MSDQIKRGSIDKSLTGRSRSASTGPWQPYRTVFVDTSVLQSAGHRGHRKLGSGDVGGPFLLQKIWYELNPIMFNDAWADGPFIATTLTGWSNSLDPDISDNTLKSVGTKGIAQTAPNNPSFNLAQAIGEIRNDGLPAITGTELWRDRAHFLKGSGSEYLNIEFGWKPLISDVRNFAHTVVNHQKIIDGYRKGSDQKIRRRFALPPVTSSKSMVGTGFLVPPTRTRSVTGTMTEIGESQSWFSGAFRYHIPMGDSAQEKLARHYSYASKLLGVRLTPDTLWNLAPWSWAADWFGNTGDIMTNISNLGSDGLVMQYGYAMASVKKEVTLAFNYQGRNGFYRRTFEKKRRIPASPYGFAVTFDGLSNRQKAVCAALGITRVR